LSALQHYVTVTPPSDLACLRTSK